MVGERLVDPEEHRLRRRLGRVAVRRHRVAGDHRVAVEVRVVDEEEAVGGVVRVEGDAQEPAFAAGTYPVADVEEGPRQEHAVQGVEDDDLAALEGDEETPVAGVGDGDGGIEAGGQNLEVEPLDVDAEKVGRRRRREDDRQDEHEAPSIPFLRVVHGFSLV